MSTPPTSPPKESPVVCRFNPKLGWAVGLGTLETAFMLFVPVLAANSSPAPQNPWAVAIMGAFGALLFGSITGYLATELIRSEIRADEHGLTWRRGLGNWKNARWEEISDFYIHKYNSSRIVETPQGKLELSRSFVGVDEIAKLVSHHASNSPEHQWGRKGFRSQDAWSLSLSMWSNSEKWTAPLVSGVLLLCVPLLVGSISTNPRNAFNVWAWYDAFGVIAMLLSLVALGAAVIWLMLTIWQERRFAWLHSAETLVLDAKGLTFSSTQMRVEAQWGQLQTIERLSRQNKFPRVLVRTDRGDFVLWAIPNSTMWLQFRRLAQEYAPWSTESLTKQEARESLDEDLDGPRGAWSGPNRGEGAQVFSLRSRGNRLILLCVSVTLAFLPFFYLINLYFTASEESPFHPAWPLFGVVCICVAAMTGMMCLWFKRTSVWVDGQGLMLHWPLRAPRRVRWEEIEDVGRDAWGEWVRTPSHKIYFTFLLNPARHDDLLQLIESRGQKPPSADEFTGS